MTESGDRDHVDHGELAGLIVDYSGVLTDPGESGTGRSPLLDLVRNAREAGIRTALLSNADAFDHRTHQPEWAELFDAVVLSGAVGVAKPDPQVYLLAARELRLRPGRCVFVDDLRANVDGAVKVGMVGVQHRSVTSTVDELGVLFDRDLLP